LRAVLNVQMAALPTAASRAMLLLFRARRTRVRPSPTTQDLQRCSSSVASIDATRLVRPAAGLVAGSSRGSVGGAAGPADHRDLTHAGGSAGRLANRVRSGVGSPRALAASGFADRCGERTSGARAGGRTASAREVHEHPVRRHRRPCSTSPDCRQSSVERHQVHAAGRHCSTLAGRRRNPRRGHGPGLGCWIRRAVRASIVRAVYAAPAGS